MAFSEGVTVSENQRGTGKRKAEVVRIWMKQYESVENARWAISKFIEVYHRERQHRSLGMLTLSNWMARFAA